MPSIVSKEQANDDVVMANAAAKIRDIAMKANAGDMIEESTKIDDSRKKLVSPSSEGGAHSEACSQGS